MEKQHPSVGDFIATKGAVYRVVAVGLTALLVAHVETGDTISLPLPTAETNR